MNVALIFAGGTGQRMNTKSSPKQFLLLHGKPIIIYTLEHFENHPQIDGIVVVCLNGWHDYLRKQLRKFDIEKVAAIVDGGANGQESIYNGVKKIHELYPEDTVVLVHDGVRPLIDEDTISRNINCVKEHGNAITVTQAVETITMAENGVGIVEEIAERSKCWMARAPQSFCLKDLYEAHQRARREGKTEFIDSASLMHHYGATLHTIVGANNNIKITTPTDFYIFRAVMDAKESEQIIGM